MRIPWHNCTRSFFILPVLAVALVAIIACSAAEQPTATPIPPPAAAASEPAAAPTAMPADSAAPDNSMMAEEDVGRRCPRLLETSH